MSRNCESLNNVLHRQILPALTRCETCGRSEAGHAESRHTFKLDQAFPKWRGWHAARRGLGTNLYALGVPEKVIQDILRHERDHNIHVLHQDDSGAGE